ncbi:MAG TPA: DHHA1 domain-containing protein, partial [Candidatus Krumholzibacterium sp.]|nr:DHHA1 domain-containing protein [Candidatus Krumholzibacterium sp.]
DVSTELCGGTHLDNAGRIGTFMIVSESSVAAGVRRIEAVTAKGAFEHVLRLIAVLEESGWMLRIQPQELPERITTLLSEIDGMKKEIKRLEKGDAGGGLDVLIGSAVDVAGSKIVSGRLDVKDAGALRSQADLFRTRVRSGVAILSVPSNGKMHYVVTVTDDLIERNVTADGIVKELSAVAGGGGGGKRHLAQLGTREMESEESVFAALPGIVERLLSERSQ